MPGTHVAPKLPLIPPPQRQEPPPPGALLTVSPSLCSLSFVFLEDRTFIFLLRDQSRVGALGAWHCARDLGRERQGRGLGGKLGDGERQLGWEQLGPCSLTLRSSRLHLPV